MPSKTKTVQNKAKPVFWDETTTKLKKLTMLAQDKYTITGKLEDKTAYTNLKRAYDRQVKDKKNSTHHEQDYQLM
jgi:hypothetical protein